MEKKQVYMCEKCGNVVESLWSSDIGLSCCGQEMKKMAANTVDAAKEKHVPIIIKNGNMVTVNVGSVDHPMTPEHFILFIEVVTGDKVYRHDFKEGDTKAQAIFCIEGDDELVARAYCNLHGFWSSH